MRRCQLENKIARARMTRRVALRMYPPDYNAPERVDLDNPCDGLDAGRRVHEDCTRTTILRTVEQVVPPFGRTIPPTLIGYMSYLACYC
jgi:hypothetical protein